MIRRPGRLEDTLPAYLVAKLAKQLDLAQIDKVPQPDSSGFSGHAPLIYLARLT
jgi:hypothetical protein